MNKFNDFILDDLVVVEDVIVDLMPPIDVIFKEGARRSYARGRSSEPRYIEMDIRIIEDDHATVVEKAKELARILDVDGDKTLITRRRPEEYILAQLNGSTPIEQLLHTGYCKLTFVSAEGVYHSNMLHKDMTSGTNAGTLPAKPILTFTASGSTHTISNGKQTINLEGLSSGDVVIIDTDLGKITVNGATGNQHEMLTSRSDLFELPVGPWTITGAKATYRERSR